MHLETGKKKKKGRKIHGHIWEKKSELPNMTLKNISNVSACTWGAVSQQAINVGMIWWMFNKTAREHNCNKISSWQSRQVLQTLPTFQRPTPYLSPGFSHPGRLNVEPQETESVSETSVGVGLWNVGWGRSLKCRLDLLTRLSAWKYFTEFCYREGFKARKDRSSVCSNQYKFI